MGASLPKQMNVEPAARPLRIAFVYSRLPFPMMRGDQLTVSHLLSFLAARGHTVDFHTLATGGKVEPAQREWLDKACRTVRFYDQPKIAMLLGMVRALFTGIPFQVGLFHNAKLAADLEAGIGAGDYDIAYCYYLRTSPAIPDPTRSSAKGWRSFLAMQLSQTLNARRIFENETNLAKRIFYFFEAKRLARYEARIWRKFSRTVLIGPADVAAIREECRRQGMPEIDNWVYGAHGTDTERFQPATREEMVPNRVVFSGSMLYQPNIQAALWFVQRCWPAIRAAVPDAEFIIQGRDPVPEIQRLAGKDGIVVTGTVPDVGAMIRSATVCVNPMLAAGGMQNKLIEYMACGKATVATAVANEGIRAPADTLISADEPEAISEAIIALLRDPDAAHALGQRARAYASRDWTWEKHFLDLEQAFYDSLEDRGQ
ncbi:glycosyltransferase [Sphingomonas oryzagri]|uniref:Glycosyltransferase family 4 protein n=1 Tax=Sphingomonas oryzagri TaxID=3042314 RepID=A0ABT6MW68_9SPHN|nr:glycosyltransferase family 4 protein [Sphingomonas oryzagri]MDH7637275.1 glycosyltransferase family 4 protein [Sphingomonas oryzagri]